MAGLPSNLPLAMAMMGGGGVNPAMMDPSFLGIQNQMSMGQNLMQEGTDTSPAYPAQALARAIAGLTGGYMLNRAYSKLGQSYNGAGAPADTAANVLGPNHPITMALRSPSPMIRMEAMQAFEAVMEKAPLRVDDGSAAGTATPPAAATGVTAPAGGASSTPAAAPTTMGGRYLSRYNALMSEAQQKAAQGWSSDVVKNLETQAAQDPGKLFFDKQTADGLQLADDGVTWRNPDGTVNAAATKAGAVSAAQANAAVPAQEAVAGFKGAVDTAVANNAPQKTGEGEQFSVNPNRVPIPSVTLPAAPAVGGIPAAAPPPGSTMAPAVQPVVPVPNNAGPGVPAVQTAPLAPPAQSELPPPLLRPDQGAVTGNAGPAGAASLPPVDGTAGSAFTSNPMQSGAELRPAAPLAPPPNPVTPAPAHVSPPAPAEIKQNGGETITSNPYPPADILKGRYDQYNKLSDAAGQAREEGQKAQLLQQKLDQLGMGGPAIPFVANLTRFAQEAGVSPEWLKENGLPNGATEEQANKLSIDLLGEVLKAQFPQRITNNDIMLFRKTVAGPGLMPESSKFLIDNIVMPKVQRDIDRFGAVVDLPGKDRALDGFNRTLFDFDNKHPLSSYTPSLQPAKAPAGSPEGAKQAPDGNWYVPDPARQGKWLKVVMPNG